MSQIGDFMAALSPCGSVLVLLILFRIHELRPDASASGAGKPSGFPPAVFEVFRAAEYASLGRRFAGLLSLALWLAEGNAALQIEKNFWGARIHVRHAIRIG
jgi:hypothetical protein